MLEKIKLLLGITGTDRDELLTLIISETSSRMSNRYLGGAEIPEALQYIVVAVSVIRYNQIGSEGLDSQTVEGESLSFRDDDFAAYEDDIGGWLSQQTEIDPGSSVGRVRFL